MDNNCNKITGAVLNLIEYHDLISYISKDGEQYTLVVGSKDASSAGDYDSHEFYSTDINDLFVVMNQFATPVQSIFIHFVVHNATGEYGE